MTCMIRRGSVTATAIAALSVGAFAGMGEAEAQQEWRFALEEVDGSVQDAYAEEFKRLVEEKSDGEITVTIYPYGALGTSADLTEQTANGAIQLTHASPGHLGSLVEEIQVFSIPYLLSDDNSVNKEVLSSSETIYGPLAESFTEHNLKLLSMYPEGQMVWTANKPIRTPEDLDGFRIRTMVSPMLTEAYEAFGASPTPMPYGEIYGGLQLRNIDGQVNPLFAIEEMGFYEVQDYLIFTGEQQFTTTVVANNQWYESLDSEHQQIIDETISELYDYIFQVQEEYNEERLQKMLDEREELEVIELTEEERQVFAERSYQVRDAFVEMTGESGEEILTSLAEEFGTTRE